MNKLLRTALVLTCGIGLLGGCVEAEKPADGLPKTIASDARPNFLVIVVDDLGFSDLGAFGGEIDTPNLDALAMSGIRFTSFYTAPTCSPTRSMLLTGKDSHSVGLGAMGEALPMYPVLQGKPGYEGYLDPAATTIAEKFSAANYKTIMTGKWHLGTKPEQQPSEHGFEKSFILQQGGADHFGEGQNGSPALIAVAYTEDGKPAEYPMGKYSSDFYAEQMIDYMTPTDGDDRPFFAYLAFTAPHWPLQAPKDLIAKYEGKYDSGPTAKRSARLKRMKKLGLLDDATLAADLKTLQNWDELSAEERKISSRTMEIYAAMVDSVDLNVGKVLDHLKSTGQFENTVIIFMSDNGAEGTEPNQLIGMASQMSNVTPEFVANVQAANVDLEKMGTQDSFIAYGKQWGQAAMAPFREHKAMTEEGGVKSPAFITGPGISGGRIVNGVVSVRDIMPTTLDISGVSHEVGGVSSTGELAGPQALSWAPILNGSTDSVRSENDPLAWELFFRRGVRLGDWKAVYRSDNMGLPSPGSTAGSWRLYNLRTDPGESTDVKAENPEAFARVMEVWKIYAEENGVVEENSQSGPH